MRGLFLPLVLFVLITTARAQDSVDVTFRYFPVDNPSIVHLPGEFNNWANNSGGQINPGTRWTMEKLPDGSWQKTVRLRVDGGSGPGGSYEYKINEEGSSSGWRADPLNPRTYGSFQNSIIYVQRPTVFHVQPVPGAVVSTSTPELVADVFPVTTQQIDTGASHVLVNGIQVATFGSAYDASSGILRLTLPPLQDGEHSIVVVGVETDASESRDSTRFTVSASPLRWLTRDNPAVYREHVQLDGLATDARLSDVTVVKNGTDSITVSVQDDRFSLPTPLDEGDNHFQAFGQLDGSPVSTQVLTLTHIVDHDPKPEMEIRIAGANIELSFAGSGSGGGPLYLRWVSEDHLNPEPLGIDQTGGVISFRRSLTPGEYFIRLEATDEDSNFNYVRHYITIPDPDGPPTLPTLSGINDNPSWVRDAIIYEVFVPAFSSNGDLKGVTAGIPHMKNLGVNTLWLMPIFDNPGSINEFNGGYSIIDFYAVDESIGTTADFDELVDSCHANGIRVILDMTPNHVASAHPWVNDIRKWKDYSIYRPFIETRLLGSPRDIGHSVVREDGYDLYARYSNWSLPNLNLANEETQRAMLDVYRYWLVDRNADGFRLDVYWGPQNRYGEKVWWRPFREAIKYYKPEAMLLGETDGTGQGSEINYADGGGGLDVGYDWNWYGQIKSTLAGPDINALHDRTANYSPNENYNHYTGPNAHYFRMMENHDETRIAEMFRSDVNRTRPGAAVMMTAPGIPLIYAGQEIGWRGRRNKINFTAPPSGHLLPFYSRLAAIRSKYRALRSPWINRLQNGTAGVYSFLRPTVDQNFMTIANFRDIGVPVTVELPLTDLDVSTPLETGRTYYLNDLMIDSTFTVTMDDLSALNFDLAPFQSRILLFSDSAMFPLVTSVRELPAGATQGFRLLQNYPNPVPADSPMSIQYDLGGAEGSRYTVHIVLIDQLGREVHRSPALDRTRGTHHQLLDLSGIPAGHYSCRVIARGAAGAAFWTEVIGVTVL